MSNRKASRTGGLPWRRVLGYLRPDRTRFTLLGLAIVGLAIPLTLLEPYLVQRATERVLRGRDTRALAGVIGLGLAYYGARFAVELLLNYAGLRLAYGVHVRVLRDSLWRFLGKDIEVVKSVPRGDFLYCFFNDTVRVAGFVSSDVVGLFSNVVLLLACFGLMFVFNASLAVPCLLWFTMIAAIHARLAGRLLRWRLTAKGIDQELTGKLQGVLSGIITLKSFGWLEGSVHRWIERYRPRWMVEISIRMTEIVLTSIATHAHILFSFVILFLALRGDALVTSLGRTFAFLVLYNRMATPFHYMIGFWLSLQESRAAIVRFYRVYDLQTTSGRPGTDSRLSLLTDRRTPVQTLELRRGVARRGGQEIPLPDLCFQAGRTYLLRGPNGSGKTTAGLALAGFLPVSGGEYRLNGSAHPPPRERCRIIFLEQEGYWPEGTLADHLRMGDPPAELDEARMMRWIEVCGCAELIRSLPLGLSNPIARDWKLLSDGESQRLFLAFALYHEPQVLVIDEALCHVPFEGRQAMVRAIRAEQPDVLLVLISHDDQDRGLADQTVEFVGPTRPRFSGLAGPATTGPGLRGRPPRSGVH